MRRAVPLIVIFWSGFSRLKKMQILRMEFSRKVESVGRAETRFGEGSRYLDSTGFSFGTYAEYVCLLKMRYGRLSRSNMSFEEAAAVLLAGYHRCISLGKQRSKPEIAQNVVESQRLSILIDYATATPFAIGFWETALAIEDSSNGIWRRPITLRNWRSATSNPEPTHRSI